MNDTCKDCTDWNSCPGFDYFLPSDIKYCRPQMLWLLSQWDFLEAYFYPPDFRITRHNDIGSVGHSTKAPFQLAADIHGEIELRSKSARKTHDDRWRLLLAEAQLGCKYFALSPGAQSVLNYLSGKRKRQTYSAWLKQRKYNERRR